MCSVLLFLMMGISGRKILSGLAQEKHPQGDKLKTYYEFASIHENKHEIFSKLCTLKVTTNTMPHTRG